MAWQDKFEVVETSPHARDEYGFAVLLRQDIDGANYIGCTPQDAREIAAELLRLADAHDARKGE